MIRAPGRLTLTIGLAAAAVMLPTAAHAASPQPGKISESGGFTDTNFCGTGETVVIAFSVKGVEFGSPKQADFVGTFRGTETLTYRNPDTGEETTVIRRFANRFTDTVIAGVEGGAHTHAFSSIGLPELFMVKGGGVITRDAGRITFIVAFDERGNETLVDLISAGPHPQADSDFELFCQVIPEALGIE